jgi:hypothetical protein
VIIVAICLAIELKSAIKALAILCWLLVGLPLVWNLFIARSFGRTGLDKVCRWAILVACACVGLAVVNKIF